jgi:adenylate cyclase class IV
MIEVEKKFKLTEDNKRKLIEGAEFLGEKIQTDSYFDTANFDLARKDMWFRNRNGKFELKTPLSNLPKKERVSDQYVEIEDENEIARILGISFDYVRGKISEYMYRNIPKIAKELYDLGILDS